MGQVQLGPGMRRVGLVAGKGLAQLGVGRGRMAVLEGSEDTVLEGSEDTVLVAVDLGGLGAGRDLVLLGAGKGRLDRIEKTEKTQGKLRYLRQDEDAFDGAEGKLHMP